ncbi:MAG: NEL-type E3 ubiquitin ligase domain-containing protein [Parachlamydiaceae bacterium]
MPTAPIRPAPPTTARSSARNLERRASGVKTVVAKVVVGVVTVFPDPKMALLDVWEKKSLGGPGCELERANRAEAAKRIRAASLQTNTEGEEEAEIQVKLDLSNLGLENSDFPPLDSLEDDQVTGINLSGNKLSSFPTEILKFTKLKELSLEKNNLSNLQESLSNLTTLEILNLSRNKLTKLPNTMHLMTSLKTLDFSKNNFTEFPEQICNIESLEVLSMVENKLEKLPREIGKLKSLLSLSVSDNKLTSLPVSLRLLTKLKYIHFKKNPELTHIPLCLGSLLHLHLNSYKDDYIPGTKVRTDLTTAIMKMSQDKKINFLSNQLEAWRFAAGGRRSKLNLTSFSPEEKKNISNWLDRLSQTIDMETQPLKIAEIAYEILKTARKNRSFKEKIINLMISNNEGCEDRSAMNLNIMYAFLKLEKLGSKVPLKEKIDILAGAVKTRTLREVIGDLINEEQNKTGTIIDEGVEIYLYYESLLKRDLSLTSITENMAHADIGEREWIIIPAVIKEVQETCWVQLETSEDLRKFIEKEPGFTLAENKFKKNWQGFEEQFTKEMSDLDDRMSFSSLGNESTTDGSKSEVMSDDEYLKAANTLMKEKKTIYNQEYSKMVEEWIKTIP